MDQLRFLVAQAESGVEPPHSKQNGGLKPAATHCSQGFEAKEKQDPKQQLGAKPRCSIDSVSFAMLPIKRLHFRLPGQMPRKHGA